VLSKRPISKSGERASVPAIERYARSRKLAVKSNAFRSPSGHEHGKCPGFDGYAATPMADCPLPYEIQTRQVSIGDGQIEGHLQPLHLRLRGKASTRFLPRQVQVELDDVSLVNGASI
jgi:hypothetical protein